ncbi:MAG: hypothetical protein AAFV36_07310, partial [Myxococcota bacterium]
MSVWLSDLGLTWASRSSGVPVSVRDGRGSLVFARVRDAVWRARDMPACTGERRLHLHGREALALARERGAC